MLIKTLILLTTAAYTCHGLWEDGGNWASSCEFQHNHLAEILSSEQDCEGQCASTFNCTHYTWTTFNGGTCWLKHGNVSKDDAEEVQGSSSRCGLLKVDDVGSVSTEVPIDIIDIEGLSEDGRDSVSLCEFQHNHLAEILSSEQDCEGQCASTFNCTHYTWTTYNGGTCWLKHGNVSEDDAEEVQASYSRCGLVEVNDVGSVSTEVPIDITDISAINNVPATRHGAREFGACALPKLRYNVQYPVALGDLPALKNLRFKPELCGHVLKVDCGHGKLDVIINNSNLGGGLDLYGSSWDKLTNHKAPGVTKCSVELSSRNAIARAASYMCYYKPGTGNTNRYYHNVGLLNTEDKLVTGAMIGNKVGSHRGTNPYFAFDGEVDNNEFVRFSLDDGSKISVKLGSCIYLNEEQMWS